MCLMENNGGPDHKKLEPVFCNIKRLESGFGGKTKINLMSL